MRRRFQFDKQPIKLNVIDITDITDLIVIPCVKFIPEKTNITKYRNRFKTNSVCQYVC